MKKIILRGLEKMTQKIPTLNKGKKNENNRTANQEKFLLWHKDYKLRIATSLSKDKRGN